MLVQAAYTSLVYNICKYIPLTNRVCGPYCKLRTEFFLLGFMAQARSLSEFILRLLIIQLRRNQHKYVNLICYGLAYTNPH